MPDPLSTPPPTVAGYLQQSRAAHTSYRAQSRSCDYPALDVLIRMALEARQAAHALDPAQADPAWVSDQQINKGVPSADLVAFYQRHLQAAP